MPSQSSDVDQYLDDLFMPVLDGNMDEFSDARSLAASIKGWADENRRPAGGGQLDIVDEVVPDLGLDDVDVDVEAFVASVRGGGKDPKEGREHYSNRDSLYHPVGISIPPGTPQQPIGLIPPSPLLVSGFYGGKSVSLSDGRSVEHCVTPSRPVSFFFFPPVKPTRRTLTPGS